MDADRQQKRPLFDAQVLAAELAESFSRPFNAKDLDLKGFEYDTDRERFTFHVDSIRFTYNADTRLLVRGDSLEKEERGLASWNAW